MRLCARAPGPPPSRLPAAAEGRGAERGARAGGGGGSGGPRALWRPPRTKPGGGRRSGWLFLSPPFPAAAGKGLSACLGCEWRGQGEGGWWWWWWAGAPSSPVVNSVLKQWQKRSKWALYFSPLQFPSCPPHGLLFQSRRNPVNHLIKTKTWIKHPFLYYKLPALRLSLPWSPLKKTPETLLKGGGGGYFASSFQLCFLFHWLLSQDLNCLAV